LQNRDGDTSVRGKGAGKIDGLFEKRSEANDEHRVAAQVEINTLGSAEHCETWVPKRCSLPCVLHGQSSRRAGRAACVKGWILPRAILILALLSLAVFVPAT